MAVLRIGYDELGQTSPRTLGEVCDAFLQVIDVEVLLKGVVRSSSRAIRGAVIDGLFSSPTSRPQDPAGGTRQESGNGGVLSGAMGAVTSS